MDEMNGQSPEEPAIAPEAEDAFQREQRRSRRIPLEAIVHYQVDGSEFINLSSNVSAEGIFIRNFSPPPVGTELRIRVSMPEDRGGVQVQLIGRVVRVVEGVGVDDRGMGVEFESVQAETMEAVRRFVSEVYELDHLERLEMDRDSESGRFRYVPRPEDVLRLETDGRAQRAMSQEIHRAARYRLLRAILLVLVGILLGGGFVFLFFLLD
jgi:uncharacterized protein (TIGR02266 family)